MPFRRRTPRRLVCGLVAVAGLLWPGSATAASCASPRSSTLAASPTARLFSRDSRFARGVPVYFGCAFATGTPFRIGDGGGFPDSSSAGPFRLAGPIAGYGTSFVGRSDSRYSVLVRDLRTGRVWRRLEAVDNGPPNYEDRNAVGDGFKDLEVNGLGTVAWTIVNPYSSPVVPEVYLADRAGMRKLDAGRHVLPTSLRLRPGAVEWRTTKGTRSAALVEGP